MIALFQNVGGIVSAGIGDNCEVELWEEAERLDVNVDDLVE